MISSMHKTKPKCSAAWRALAATLAILLTCQQSLVLAGDALAPRSLFSASADKERDNKPHEKRFDFSDDAAIAAAEEVIQQIEEHNHDGKPTVIVFFTGQTARIFYREFVALVKERHVDLSRVITFNLDEYVISPKHPKSYRSFMQAELFDHVNIKPENIHFLSAYDTQGNLLEPEALQPHIRAYEKELEQAGGADIAMLGIGRNGHIAFNEPNEPKTSPSVLTHEVVLSENTREANAPDFENDPAKVPPKALTMGIGSILKAKKILMLAFGESKKDAVEQMTKGPITNALPASFLRRHHDVSVYTDAKAVPKKLSRLQTWGRGTYRYGLATFFWALWHVNEWKVKYPVQSFVAASSLAIAAAVWQFGPIGLVGVGAIVLFVMWRDHTLNQVNPFHGLKPGQSKRVGDVIYGVLPDKQGNEWHFARPAEQTDPKRPVIVFDHGREPFELLVGAQSKVEDFSHVFSPQGYDVRYYWKKAKSPTCSFLYGYATGRYLRPGKNLSDHSMILSTSYAGMPYWPFSNIVKFKAMAAGALKYIHELVQNKGLAPAFTPVKQEGEKVSQASNIASENVPDSMVAVSYSVGARARFIEALNEHVRYDPKTGIRTLDSDFNPKVRGLILINSFFHVSRVANKYMRWQRKWFWDHLAKFLGLSKSAYDEMDRSSDLTKIHERARLAAQHKDWPQVVWITTRVDDPRLVPLPWADYYERVTKAKGWERWPAIRRVLWKIFEESKKKIKAAYYRDANLPWYHWVGSIFWDARGNDGIVDPDLAAGLDYYGKPLDPKAISIVIRGMAHDAMGEPLVHRLSSQFADLIADGADLHRAYLEISRNGAEPRRVFLKDHKPDQPILLDADEKVNVYYVTPMESLEGIKEKLLSEELLRESPLPAAVKDWNAQPVKALKALELFKSALARRAWPLVAEVERKGPNLNPQEEGATRKMMQDLLSWDGIAFTVLMQIWLAKGLVGVARIPPGEDADWWNKFIAHGAEIAGDRSKSRWVSHPFGLEDLRALHMADKKFQAHAPELIWGMNPDFLEQFNEILTRLMNSGDIWRDLVESEEFKKWMEDRGDDFSQWLEKTPGADVLAYRLLGIKGTPALEALWGQYTSTPQKKNAKELYALLVEFKPRRVLQMLITLDIKMPVGSAVHALGLSGQWDAHAVESAA